MTTPDHSADLTLDQVRAGYGRTVVIDGVSLDLRRGAHGPEDKVGSVFLTKGDHSFLVKYFEAYGGPAGITLTMPNSTLVDAGTINLVNGTADPSNPEGPLAAGGYGFVAHYSDGIRRLLPEQMPCKENLAFLGAELIRNASDTDEVLSSTDAV